MHVSENMHQNKRLTALKITSNKILLARAHQKSSMIHRWSQKTHGLLKAVLLVSWREGEQSNVSQVLMPHGLGHFMGIDTHDVPWRQTWQLMKSPLTMAASWPHGSCLGHVGIKKQTIRKIEERKERKEHHQSVGAGIPDMTFRGYSWHMLAHVFFKATETSNISMAWGGRLSQRIPTWWPCWAPGASATGGQEINTRLQMGSLVKFWAKMFLLRDFPYLLSLY